MTFRIPKETFADKILALMGKKRAIWIPIDVYKRFGLYVIVQAKREYFWRALFGLKIRNLHRGGS